MKTLKKQISLFGEDESISSQEDSPANPSVSQETSLEQKMTAISGRNTLERYAKFNRDGLLAKMYPGLLIGMEGWFSTRCKLTWSLRGTKSSRLYFQLVVSTLPIEETESGLLATPNTMDYMPPKSEEMTHNHPSRPGRTKSGNLREQIAYKQVMLPTVQTQELKVCDENGKTQFMNLKLLPTPTVMDTNCGDLEKIDQRRTRAKESKINGNGFGVTIGELANRGLLPTPRTTDVEGGKINNLDISETGKFSRTNSKGVRHGVKLRDVVENVMLPTPRASEFKGTGPIGSSSHDHRLDRGYLDATMQEITGESGQLNPLFVSEMMGFPVDWIVLPFMVQKTQDAETFIPDGEQNP